MVTEHLQLQELSSSATMQSRHHLRTVQTTAEGTSFSGSMDTMALYDFDVQRLRRTLTYMLTYLITYLLTLRSFGALQQLVYHQKIQDIEHLKEL